MLEVQRGSYGAQYGDRTYAIFNVVPRTGFERNREAELVLGVGSFFQTDDQIQRRQSYRALRVLRERQLQPQRSWPSRHRCADVYHGRCQRWRRVCVVHFQQGLEQSVPSRDVGAPRQLPGADRSGRAGAGIADEQHESDAFVNLTWARTFGSSRLLTVSPFYHQNSANFDGGPARSGEHDGPQSLAVPRRAGHVRRGRARHSIQAGFYGFRQQDDQLFGVTFNDGSGTDVGVREQPTGHLEAVYRAGHVRRGELADADRRDPADALLGRRDRRRDQSARWRHRSRCPRLAGRFVPSTVISIRRRRS